MTWPCSCVSVVRRRFSRYGSCSRAAIFTFGFFLREEMRQPVDAVLEVAVAVEVVDMLLDQDGEVRSADREGRLAVPLAQEAADRVLADLFKLLVGVVRALAEAARVVSGPIHDRRLSFQGFSLRTFRNAVKASSTFFGVGAGELVPDIGGPSAGGGDEMLFRELQLLGELHDEEFDGGSRRSCSMSLRYCGEIGSPSSLRTFAARSFWLMPSALRASAMI